MVPAHTAHADRPAGRRTGGRLCTDEQEVRLRETCP